MEGMNLLFVLSLLCKAACVWFALVAVAGLVCRARQGRRPRYAPAAPRTRFAVLAAGRNEEAVIGGFVHSILAQDYPRELFDVYVLPNNCTDDTAGAARTAGAIVLDCPGARSKGEALHSGLARLRGMGYDAFCVFDADNQADPAFLARMNDAFCAGARVAKGRIAAQNPRAGWVAGCYGLYFRLFDLFFNEPRGALGLSAKLVGTGFAVHTEVLERLGGWNTATIAEDAEFSAQCAELGYPVAWVPGAVTRDVEPVSFRVSLVQRRRWIGGVLQAGQARGGRLARALVQRRRAVTLDSCLFFLTPLTGAVGTLLGAAGTALALGRGQLPLWAPLAAAGLGWLGCALGALILRLFLPREERPGLGSVLGFGLFMACWAPLGVLGILCPPRRWVPVDHTAHLSVRRGRRLHGKRAA